MKTNETAEARGYNAAENQVSPTFKMSFAEIKNRFFSRNPEYWSCFSEPGFKAIIDFRKQELHPAERISKYPEGDALKGRLQSLEKIPQRASDEGAKKADALLQFSAALSKDWENPASVENVITMPCDPGIYGAMMGSLANANLVYHEYSQMACELEKYVVRQMADLAGYDPEQSTGIFTQGGTFCNLYGYLLGLRKSLKGSRSHGMGGNDEYRIINSQGGHYSNITNLSVLGVDIDSKILRIQITENNHMDMDDLERQLSACFQLGCKVPAIMLTMGTTDTFGVDRVKPVYELCQRLCEHYEVEVAPHIHVDSAIGWTMLFFLDYDFENNPLEINPKTLEGLRSTTALFQELKYADSFTVDFQKWGYVPYTSSLIMVKDRGDLKYLENDPENFSYFEKETQGHTHLQSTIECSRGAAGTFGAYAALNYMGIEGYQQVIAHCLQNANYFRSRLSQLGFIKVIAHQNQGPSVGFRTYNPERVSDAEAEFDYEYTIQNNAAYRERLERNNQWHRKLFLNRGKLGLFTNWVEFVGHTAYDAKGRMHKLPGEKAVFMNPATTRKEIDTFFASLLATMELMNAE